MNIWILNNLPEDVYQIRGRGVFSNIMSMIFTMSLSKKKHKFDSDEFILLEGSEKQGFNLFVVAIPKNFSYGDRIEILPEGKIITSYYRDNKSVKRRTIKHPIKLYFLFWLSSLTYRFIDNEWVVIEADEYIFNVEEMVAKTESFNEEVTAKAGKITFEFD